MRKLRKSAAKELASASAPQRRRATGIELIAASSQVVINCLNQDTGAGMRRVTRLIEGCHRINELVVALKRKRGSSSWQDPEISEAVTEVNIGLGYYKWHPGVNSAMDEDSHFKIHFGIQGITFDPNRILEQDSAQWIVENIDIVHRVRRCRVAKCGKWFFAKTNHQKYCQDSCRQKDIAQGQAHKEKRRVYMKKYRREQAERAERAKILASRSLGRRRR